MYDSIKREILDKIKEYDSIVIGRHIRPDGDAIGSSRGLRRIIELTYPEKKVYLSNTDTSDYLSFLGSENPPVSNETIRSSLAILLDTATADRLSNPRLFNAAELIKIDHHIKCEDFKGIEWIEDYRSSVSEMIADFYETFRDELKLDATGARCIYTGIVTDSGRFSYSSTSPETLRLAALMLSFGFDIEELQAHLDLKEYSFYRFRTALFHRIKRTSSGLLWVYVDEEFQKKWKLTRENASESVSFLSGVKGSICWLAFIDNGDGTIRVRLRSRFMTVNELASRYHGGGHDRASGATCYSKEEMMSLVEEADKAVMEYKANSTGWI